MKALLVTRCGCSRMVNTDGYPEIIVPLPAHYTKGFFRDENPAIEAILSWGDPERRVFKRDPYGDTVLAGETISVYREQPVDALRPGNKLPTAGGAPGEAETGHGRVELGAIPAPAPLSVGSEYPKEQARVREAIERYRAIGQVGTFARLALEAVLREADEAAASGDTVRQLRAFVAMRGCE